MTAPVLIADILATIKPGINHCYTVTYPPPKGRLDVIPEVIPASLQGVKGVMSWSIQKTVRLADGSAGCNLTIQTNVATKAAADALRNLIVQIAGDLKEVSMGGPVTVSCWEVDLNVL